MDLLKKGCKLRITEIEGKIPSSTGLNAAAAAAISAVENLILNISNLVKKTEYDWKISDIESKYFTTCGYNKLTNEIIDNKIHEKQLAKKSDFYGFTNNTNLGQALATIATKVGLKTEQDKTVKCQAFDLSYFWSKI